MLISFLRPDAPPVASKTDEELRYCIDNRENYLPESVLNAVAELQRRGTEFSEEEIRVIEEDMQARTELATITSPLGVINDNYENCLVDDPDANEFYSRRVIKAFTFFSSPLFGAILMAMNISKTKNFVGVLSVLAFGLGITVAEVVLIFRLNPPVLAVLLLGFVNAYLIDNLFWDKYIGNSTLYKPRKYWPPLVVAVLLIILRLVLTYYAKSIVK